MPVGPIAAFSPVSVITALARAFVLDTEIPGGDILTDQAVFTIPMINAAYEKIQRKLATHGVESYTNEVWLIGVPAVPISDPEVRTIIGFQSTIIIYPNGLNSVVANTPVLPADLIAPQKIWERQNGTTSHPGIMANPNGGLRPLEVQRYHQQWEWRGDQLVTRGALQVNDLKLRYEKHLPIIGTVDDPVPILGVNNAAAYELASIFEESRGGALAAVYPKKAEEEIENLIFINVRRRQRMPTRRRPFRGGGGSRTGTL